MDSLQQNDIEALLKNKQVIVCCGAGGVGKTSVAAALAIGAARMQKRVLVVTIDPSKRLAETLGVSQHQSEPISLPAERLSLAGIQPPGSLQAWMLDPQVVSDNVVRRFSKNEHEAQKMMKNRIYKNVTAMVAGMQEYTAVQAMHEFVKSGSYDLIILDTPPSRNALHFLEAPNRIMSFLDGRIFRFFIPSDTSLFKRATSKILNKVMDIVFGEDTRHELMAFFSMFSAIFARLNVNATEMRSFFQSEQVAFLVVTSPAQEALEEALYFEHKTRDELSLNLSGYVLNRSLAFNDGKRFPDLEYFAGSQISADTQEKLRKLARREQATIKEHRKVLEKLRARLREDEFVQALPFLAEGVADLQSLVTLVEAQEVDLAPVM